MTPKVTSLQSVVPGIKHRSKYTVFKQTWRYKFSHIRVLTDSLLFTKYTFNMAAWFSARFSDGSEPREIIGKMFMVLMVTGRV